MSGNVGLPKADQGTWQFSLNYDFNNLDTFVTGTEKLNDNSRRRETHSLMLESGYSFTDKLSADIFLSFVRQERTINQFGNTDFTYTQGLGDAVVLVKYRLLPFLTLGGGLKLPFGKANKTRESGIPLNADLQPGSGALDQILYINASHQLSDRPSFTYFGTGIIRFTGVNDDYFGQTYEFGNETQVTIGASDRLTLGSILLDPSLKFQYRKSSADQFNGSDFPASGGQFLFINPGLSVAITPDVSYQVNISLPIHADVEDAQVTPTYRLNTGVFVKLTRKAKFNQDLIDIN